LRDIAPALERQGAQVIVVGNGTPAQARAFQADEDVPFQLYVDPELRAYEALGMTRRISPATFVHSARAILDGHRQSTTAGDAHQNGGVLVFDGDGTLRFAYISRYAGDHVHPERILESLVSLAA
jgi:hypothetical protein